MEHAVVVEETKADPTLALSTKVEEDFVAPLTAMRGALEILRDYPDLSADERLRFIETAIGGCARLEQAIRELGDTVYAAGRAATDRSADVSSEDYERYVQRITFLDDIDTIEFDFSEFVFSDSSIVNHFYDVAEDLIEATGRKWYVLVNYRDCRIWPEAWVAFAHRGQAINVTYSLGTVRYVEGDASGAATDPDMFASRDAALARLDEMKRES